MKRFHQPSFKKYYGTSNPLTHLKDYLHKMSSWTSNEPLMCIIISSSLGPLVQNCYFTSFPAAWDLSARIGNSLYVLVQ